MNLPFQRIAVVGLGLIGGSLVKSFRRRMPECKLIGVDSRDILAAAQEYLDGVFEPEALAQAVREADLIFLAAPINTILQQLPEVAQSIPPGAVVTDVGSTKSLIVEQAHQYFIGERYFIGGHPMTGRELGGWENSDAQLFENAAYVLTPAPDFPAGLLQSLRAVLQSLGARVMTLDSALHDHIVAEVSHLPQLLAVALMNFVGRQNHQLDLGLQLAGGGFRDMTRLAASPVEIWRDIFTSNQKNLQTSLKAFIVELQKMSDDFDRASIESAFHRANHLRQRLTQWR